MGRVGGSKPRARGPLDRGRRRVCHTGRALRRTLSLEESRAATIPAGIAFPDVPGWLDVGHPDTCEELAQTALASGATIVRDVREVTVTAGSRPSVDYAIDGVTRSVAARMIVGADGRNSTTRRQMGIELEQSAVRTHGAGCWCRASMHGRWTSGRWARSATSTTS